MFVHLLSYVNFSVFVEAKFLEPFHFLWCSENVVFQIFGMIKILHFNKNLRVFCNCQFLTISAALIYFSKY